MVQNHSHKWTATDKTNNTFQLIAFNLDKEQAEFNLIYREQCAEPKQSKDICHLKCFKNIVPEPSAELYTPTVMIGVEVQRETQCRDQQISQAPLFLSRDHYQMLAEQELLGPEQPPQITINHPPLPNSFLQYMSQSHNHVCTVITNRQLI